MLNIFFGFFVLGIIFVNEKSRPKSDIKEISLPEDINVTASPTCDAVKKFAAIIHKEKLTIALKIFADEIKNELDIKLSFNILI